MALTHTMRLANRVHGFHLNDAERAARSWRTPWCSSGSPAPAEAPRYLLKCAPLADAIDAARQTELLRIATDWARARRVGMVFATSQHERTTRYADDVLVPRSGELVAHGPANASITV